MTNFWDSILSFARVTVERVGQQLLQDFGSVQADEKDDGSLVTKSDNWADAEIRSAIASTFPSHGILSEEGEQVFPDTEWCWVVDPLDGTTNFLGEFRFGVFLWVCCIAELRFLAACICRQLISLFTVFMPLIWRAACLTICLKVRF
jgi:Archaeal fructose-1,6-bisphosphatase and related enzymes of inositol monophosphatase family